MASSDNLVSSSEVGGQPVKPGNDEVTQLFQQIEELIKQERNKLERADRPVNGILNMDKITATGNKAGVKDDGNDTGRSEHNYSFEVTHFGTFASGSVNGQPVRDVSANSHGGNDTCQVNGTDNGGGVVYFPTTRDTTVCSSSVADQMDIRPSLQAKSTWSGQPRTAAAVLESWRLRAKRLPSSRSADTSKVDMYGQRLRQRYEHGIADMGSYFRVKTLDYCAYCNREFDNWPTSMVHSPCYFFRLQTKAVNSGQEPFKGEGWTFRCEVCSHVFQNLKSLRKHMHYHGPKTYGCKTCSTMYQTIDLVNWHLSADRLTGRTKAIESGVDQKESKMTTQNFGCSHSLFRCDVCSKTFANMVSVRVHSEVHIGRFELFRNNDL